jgi:hypothetical protein
MTGPPPSEPTPRAPSLPWWAHGLALAWGPAIIVFGMATDEMGDRRPLVLAGFAVVLSAAAWLAAASLGRHLAAAAAQADKPYVVRHRGLVFAAPMWSAMTTVAVRNALAMEVDPGVAGIAFDALVLGTMHAPVWLWGGAMWQRLFDRGMKSMSGGGKDGK